VTSIFSLLGLETTPVPESILDRTDPQQSQVYAAEFFTYRPYIHKHLSLIECQTLVLTIFRDHTLNSKYPGSFDRPCRLYGMASDGTTAACVDSDAVYLTNDGQLAYVICHEISHVIAMRHYGEHIEGHGREFRSVHINIARAVFGRTVSLALRIAYAAADLKYDLNDIPDCHCWLCGRTKYHLKPNGFELAAG
jgi:hypothetical protein